MQFTHVISVIWISFHNFAIESTQKPGNLLESSIKLCLRLHLTARV